MIVHFVSEMDQTLVWTNNTLTSLELKLTKINSSTSVVDGLFYKRNGVLVTSIKKWKC